MLIGGRRSKEELAGLAREGGVGKPQQALPPLEPPTHPPSTCNARAPLEGALALQVQGGGIGGPCGGGERGEDMGVFSCIFYI